MIALTQSIQREVRKQTKWLLLLIKALHKTLHKMMSKYAMKEMIKKI